MLDKLGNFEKILNLTPLVILVIYFLLNFLFIENKKKKNKKNIYINKSLVSEKNNFDNGPQKMDLTKLNEW